MEPIPISEAILSEHVLKAAEQIERGEYSTSPSRSYDVIINGKPYPPKEILRLSYKIATGQDVGKIYGGEPTNKFLRDLGFPIETKTGQEDFTWLDTYRKISEKLLLFQNRQEKLVEILKLAGINQGLTDEDANGKTPLTVMDPFTFFSCIHKTKNFEKRKDIVYKILSSLDIEADITDFSGIPSSNAFNVWYFGYKKDRNATDVQTMWKLFKQALSGEITEDAFTDALKVDTVKIAKLTTALFVTNPEHFLPINAQTIPFLEGNGIRAIGNTLAAYKNILTNASGKFRQPFYIISQRAFIENTKKTFWKVGTSDEEVSYWSEMKDEPCVKIGWPTIGNLKLHKISSRDEVYTKLKEKGITYNGSNSKVSKKAGEIFSFFKNMKIGDFVLGQQHNRILGIGQITGDYYFDENDDFPHKRPVEWLITDREFPEQTEGYLNTIHEIKDQVLKNELLQYIEDAEQSNIHLEQIIAQMIPLNQILYGPPGTGKTYNSINYALSIIDGESHVNNLMKEHGRKAIIERYEELRKEGRIDFISFHQNYSYEEFVQGLRPKIESASGLSFEKRDGIFKKISDEAMKNFIESEENEVLVEPTFEEVFEHFFKPLIDETGTVTVQMESEGYQFVLTKYNPSIENIDFTKKSGGTNHAIFIPTLKKYFEQPAIEHTQGLKYYYKPLSKAMRDKAAELKKIVTGVQRKKYVLIIDEINRGNISRVFGELITLLEEDKRWGNEHRMRLKLPSGDDFSVPKNLYLIGTMNTADKSIALLDIALRRRFDFVAMYPDVNQVHPDFQPFFNSINENIYKDRGVDFAIGHSYLMDHNDKKVDFSTAMNKRIIPLLNEYYYSAKEGKVKDLISIGLKDGSLDGRYIIVENSLGFLSIQENS